MPRNFRPRLEAAEARLAPAVGVLPYVPDGLVLLPSPDGPGLYRVVSSYQLGDVGTIRPFDDTFVGEVRAAVGDVNGDGYGDLIVAPGPGGGARVRVFDGKNKALSADFLAFEESFRGGVYVAATDVNRDGSADIVVGAGEGGGSRVRVFDSATGAPVADFLAFEETFRGGVRVAGGDFDADGVGEVVVGAGPGAGPRVVLFEVENGVSVARSFLAYEPGFTGGVYVATGGPQAFFYRSGFAPGVAADIVTGPGDGGGPLVRVFPGDGGSPESHLIGDATSRTGLRVSGSSGGIQTVTPTPAGPALAVLVRGGVLVPPEPGGGRVIATLAPGQTRLFSALVLAVDPAGTMTVRDIAEVERVVVIRADTKVTRFLTPIDFRRIPPGAYVELLIAPDGSAVSVDTYSNLLP